MEEPKFAILADIHANLEALTAVLEDAESQSVTEYFCLGDVVGYNANPQECVDIIQDKCTAVVCGNHDYYCSRRDISLDDFQPHAAAVIDWTRRQLTPQALKWLSELPMTNKFFKHSFSIVHSTMDNPSQWGYVFDIFDAESSFVYQNTTICFHGHTHTPLLFEKSSNDVHRYSNFTPGDRIALSPNGPKYFINVGSVGQPRDGIPDASYLIFEPRSKVIEFRRVPYDIDTAAKKVLDAGLPERLAKRLYIGK